MPENNAAATRQPGNGRDQRVIGHALIGKQP